MKYQWVIFDADETLFHFDNFSGLCHMFRSYSMDFTKEHFEDYQRINRPLWVAYQNGTIKAHELQTRRFEPWVEQLGVSAQQLNEHFLDSMAEICKPLEGAQELVDYLHGNGVRLAIITNGFSRLQTVRLARTGFKRYFDHLIVSEEVGLAKPHQGIFSHAFDKMGRPDKENVLMVGDTLESDILGGQNFGMDTCWLNIHNASHPEHIVPTYQIRSLLELVEHLQ